MLLGLPTGAALAQTALEPTPPLIPLPRAIAWQNGSVTLTRVALEMPKEETFLRAEATRVLRENGVTLNDRAPLKIRFLRAPVAGAPQDNAAAYALNVARGGIVISAPQSVGWLYGWQTLRQMLHKRGTTTRVRAAKIVDWPAYKWRGFMHDVGRNPQDVATLKRFIDLMARYKYNVFHLHLSDYPGYRVENRAYPQLNDPQFQEKTRRPGFFYSYAELRDLIAYCRQRGIEVVPEIDMPGHSEYFQRAFGFAMQEPRGLEIMKKVIGEFLDEIQTPYFHMGGDEVHVTNPQFIDEMADFIRARGRKVLVWWPGNRPTKGEYIVQRLGRRCAEQPGTAGHGRSRFAPQLHQPHGRAHRADADADTATRRCSTKHAHGSRPHSGPLARCQCRRGNQHLSPQPRFVRAAGRSRTLLARRRKNRMEARFHFSPALRSVLSDLSRF